MIRRLQTHCCTAEDFLDLFPTADAAGHSLLKLYQKGKIKRVGMLQGERGGRPKWLYATRNVKSDLLHHEHALSRFFLKYPNALALRNTMVDPKRLPDGKMAMENEYLVEMDCDTEPINYVISKRFKKYADFEGFVLWLCPSEERREELRENAEIVADCALFATLADALANPYGPIWTDYHGNTTEIR